MKKEITVPRIGESITEATVGIILKPSGSKVAMDDEILELETDKVNQVIYAPSAGVVQLSVQPQEVVKIGQVVGFIDADVSAQESAPAVSKAPAQKETRRMKEEFLEELTEKPAQTPVAKPVLEKPGERPETRKKLSKIRKVIAERLVEAQHTAAMLTSFNEVDMSQVVNLREKYKESFLQQYGVRLGMLPFFVKAVVSALQELLNSTPILKGMRLSIVSILISEWLSEQIEEWLCLLYATAIIFRLRIWEQPSMALPPKQEREPFLSTIYKGGDLRSQMEGSMARSFQLLF